jgi:diacylglycerol kinase family enzyme
MYYYIFDPAKLPTAKFEKMQIALQGLLSEFKIAGEAGRVTALHSMQELVETASNRGVKTLVACGTDDTFNKMLASLAGRDFTLGFIPLTDNSFLARILGVEGLLHAVKTIAARRIEQIDMAKVAQTYFISYLEFGLAAEEIKHLGFWSSLKILSGANQRAKIKIDNAYTLDLKYLSGLVVNTRPSPSDDSRIANPTDGYLDLLIMERMKRTDILKYKSFITQGRLEKLPSTTVIKCRKIEFLEPEGLSLTMEGRVVAKARATVEIIPRRLRMIVGKYRTF